MIVIETSIIPYPANSKMELFMPLKKIFLNTMPAIFILCALTASAQANPRSSVKLKALRIENTRGGQEFLILPYTKI